MTLYTLGGYTFEGNPEKMTPPESKKTVAEVDTYSGSAIFQWPALIVGQKTKLTWPSMTETMYAQLRTLYLSQDAAAFVPDDGYTYQVIVVDLDGEYFKYVLNSIPFRKDVELTLNIRSQTAV